MSNKNRNQSVENCLYQIDDEYANVDELRSEPKVLVRPRFGSRIKRCEMATTANESDLTQLQRIRSGIR